ncbi:DUF6215 domain-containing protein [Streptomyces sp. NPDC026672]|uniref:DUF6215 domain-containing protein n=1 Tax=unclassified Streptomyces TaxID=2593676 RepID=UPI0033E5032F
MTDVAHEPGKSVNTGAQVLAAVLVVGGVLGGLWAHDEYVGTGDEREPAVCPAPHDSPSSRRVSGPRLCAALNRPDLPSLLGTPQEYAETADGDESSFDLAGGTRITTPEATVTLTTYSVRLSASDDDLPVAGLTGILGARAEERTILGHPAVLYSNRTIAIRFHGREADSGPGGIARGLVVARDPKDGGGTFEIAVWRQDDVPPDDAVLLRVAEKVLPTIPGWDAG